MIDALVTPYRPAEAYRSEYNSQRSDLHGAEDVRPGFQSWYRSDSPYQWATKSKDLPENPIAELTRQKATEALRSFGNSYPPAPLKAPPLIAPVPEGVHEMVEKIHLAAEDVQGQKKVLEIHPRIPEHMRDTLTQISTVAPKLPTVDVSFFEFISDWEGKDAPQKYPQWPVNIPRSGDESAEEKPKSESGAKSDSGEKAPERARQKATGQSTKVPAQPIEAPRSAEDTVADLDDEDEHGYRGGWISPLAESRQSLNETRKELSVDAPAPPSPPPELPDAIFGEGLPPARTASINMAVHPRTPDSASNDKTEVTTASHWQPTLNGRPLVPISNPPYSWGMRPNNPSRYRPIQRPLYTPTLVIPPEDPPKKTPGWSGGNVAEPDLPTQIAPTPARQPAPSPQTSYPHLVPSETTPELTNETKTERQHSQGVDEVLAETRNESASEDIPESPVVAVEIPAVREIWPPETAPQPQAEVLLPVVPDQPPPAEGDQSPPEIAPVPVRSGAIEASEYVRLHPVEIDQPGIVCCGNRRPAIIPNVKPPSLPLVPVHPVQAPTTAAPLESEALFGISPCGVEGSLTSGIVLASLMMLF